MRFSQYLPKAILCLAVFCGSLAAQSQNFGLLTGPQGTGTTIPVISADTFGQQTTINGLPQGAFLVLPKQDISGVKYYVISNVAGSAVTVVNSNFQQPRPVAPTITAAPRTAAISPDGRRVVVIAGGLVYLIDTGFDSLIGNPFSVTGTPIDVAFSLDSQRAFILSSGTTATGQAAIVTPIDLSTSSLGQPLTISTSGTPGGLGVGPNGMLYVTVPNALIEVNPRTLQRTTDTPFISVNGFPSKPVFTPDGRYVLAVNDSPGTGSLAFIFDVINKTVTQVLRASQSLLSRLDQIAVAGDNRIYAYAKETRTLYEMSLAGGLNESGLSLFLPADARNAINGFALSNEYPSRSLIFAATTGGVNTLFKADPLTYTLDATRFAVPSGAGSNLQFIGLSPLTGITTLRAFNLKQTVTAGTTSLPLVVRAVDAQGRPISGTLVTFTAPSGISLSATSATTNADGYAQVYATTGVNAGAFQIQATALGLTLPVTFDITVPGGTGPCLSNCGTSSLAIAGGTGQIISEQQIAKQLLMVIAKDTNGNPVSGQAISFSVTQGSGTIQCTGIGDEFPYIPTGTCISNGLSVDAVTDSSGRAGVKYLGTSIFGQSFAQTVVTASSGLANVNFIITTVLVGRPNGGGQASLPIAYILKPEQEATGFRVIRGGAGTTIPGGIQIQVVAADGPQLGQPIPNVALNVGAANGADPTTVPSASCAGGTPLTDAQGVVTCDVVLGPVVNTNPVGIDVNVGGAISTPLITVVVSQGPPAKIQKLQGDNQSGRTGQQFLLRARVTDAGGNRSANVPVSWSVVQGSGTLTGAATSTDSAGETQATVTLGSTPGPLVVRISSGSGTAPATENFNLSVNVSISSVVAISGGGQVAVLNQAFGSPLVVQVLDERNQPVNGAQVAFTVAGGSATIGTPNAVSNAQGFAQTTVTASGSTGPITIRATSGGRSAEFTLTARAPGPGITTASFRNAASGFSGLTPCGIAIVSGSGVAPGVQGTVMPNQFIGALPYTLANASIDVNGIPAPIFWVSNTAQGGEALAFQTPCEVSPGLATVTLRVSGGSTTVSNVEVAKYSPGLFETVIDGRKYAVLLHSDGSYVTPDNPARRGETLTLFATGIGPVNPSSGTNRVGLGGQVSDAVIAVGVNNGGVRSEKPVYAPGYIGLYTIKFEVPADTTPGPYQPLGLIVTDPNDPNAVGNYANGSFFPII